jgi:raffinose/stachyose/melibiose transport system permease protein
MTTMRKFPTHLIVFIAPAFIIYSVFMIYPLVDSLRISLYTSVENPETNQESFEFVGLANYQRIFTDPLWSERLWGAIRNNFIFFAVHMLVQNPIALLIASLISSPHIRFRAVYRTLIFVPTILSFVLVGFIWRNVIMSPLWGIDKIIPQFDGIGGLVGNQDTMLIVTALISVWQYVGIPMMLFLAALVSIPDEVIEAARVDGATAWDIFWRIKFPLILPTVGIVGILTFVGNFNAFDLVYVMHGALAGVNYASDLLGTFFYRTYFGFQLQLGNPTMGATIAGVTFIIILTGVLLYLFGWQRRITQVEM